MQSNNNVAAVAIGQYTAVGHYETHLTDRDEVAQADKRIESDEVRALVSTVAERMEPMTRRPSGQAAAAPQQHRQQYKIKVDDSAF